MKWLTANSYYRDTSPERIAYFDKMVAFQSLLVRAFKEKEKLADLVLLAGNPLTDITNTRKIAGVFVDGQWLDRHRINAMLADLSRRNTASKEKFDRNKTMKR
ncbi:MAG: hypothetical protein KL787_04865 [Taibaiella sp.]|nr:hypothetical protein [Taibaiella sp.]